MSSIRHIFVLLQEAKNMIISYKFKNFCSYRDNVEFSMLAPPTKVKNRFTNNYIHFQNGYDINKTCVIVGENAGGKTNFVNSFKYLKYLLFSNDYIRAYKSYINSNNIQESKPDSVNDDLLRQLFEIEVLINNKIYSYHLEIDNLGIVSEELKVKKSKYAIYKEILNFKRKNIVSKPQKDANEKHLSMVANLSFIDDNKYNKSVIDKLRKDASSGLFINKLAILAIEDAYTFVDWINNFLNPVSYKHSLDLVKTAKHETEDTDILQDPRYLEILRMIDYSIVKIDVNEELPYKKSIIIRRAKNGNVFKREIANDSSGIGEFFAWAVQIFNVVYNNQCVIADEVDRVLNPVLADRIIAFINGKKHTGQFIFTTHNVLHLDLKNYMKEQIYFATKDIETLESELYSLADFPEVRYEVTKIYEFYMKGILGGVASE